MKNLFLISFFLIASCSKSGDLVMSKNAKDIFGNNSYPAISYGGYNPKTLSKNYPKVFFN